MPYTPPKTDLSNLFATPPPAPSSALHPVKSNTPAWDGDVTPVAHVSPVSQRPVLPAASRPPVRILSHIIAHFIVNSYFIDYISDIMSISS